MIIHELIDTLWNVNPSYSCLTIAGNVELIDTLWNVNEDVSCCYCTCFELIDTLWNVNTKCNRRAETVK